MSLSTCIAGLVDEGRIGKAKAGEADRIYGEQLRRLEGQMGMMAAAEVASERAIAALRAQQLRREMLAALTIRTRQRMAGDMAGYNGGAAGGGPIDPRAGPAFLSGDGRATYSNVEGRMKAVRSRAHGMIDGILADHSTNVRGQIRNRAQLSDIVRELFGKDSGNLAAKELADAWTRSAEMLRQRFNAAGGDVGKMEGWGLPQSHNSQAVRDAGYDTWRAAILPALDRARMIDPDTGMPFTDEALERALIDSFEKIRSDGWSAREPGATGQGALANRRSDARFYVFKSPEAWMEYAEQFGTGNAFDAMMGHIDGMARDIAMMEILGPNPDNSLRWLKDTLVKSAQTDRAPGTDAVDSASSAGKLIDELYDELTGASQRPRNRKAAMFGSAVRAFKTSTALGSATLSAVTDLAFQASTRLLNGLPVKGMLRDYTKLMKPGSVEDQKLAVRLGLIAEEWAGRTAGQSRAMGEEMTGEVSRRLAEGVLRVSGLNRLTQAGRWAFGMEFLSTITSARQIAFDGLDGGFRGVLERYGIGAGEWDKIRATPVEMDRGAEWIKPANIEDRALGDRLVEMIARETDHAVPTADLRTRAMINNVAKRGTVTGELLRSAFLFKGFGISVVTMQARRIMEIAGRDGAARAGKYFAGLAIGTTLMGAMALVLKDLAAGRDPSRVFDDDGNLSPEFWMGALLQGGGFGIFGDLLKSTTSRTGSGLAGTLAGPIIGDIETLGRLATSSNPAGDALKFLRQQIPGSTLWYARLAFDRMVADQLQELVDPNYRKSWRRLEKWAEEQGTEFWWSPGEMAPGRAPDMTNATEGSMLQ